MYCNYIQFRPSYRKYNRLPGAPTCLGAPAGSYTVHVTVVVQSLPNKHSLFSIDKTLAHRQHNILLEQADMHGPHPLTLTTVIVTTKNKAKHKECQQLKEKKKRERAKMWPINLYINHSLSVKYVYAVFTYICMVFTAF